MTEFGALIFATEYSIDPVTLSQALESRGFDAMFLTEHSHIPVSRKTPWPGGKGKDLPKEYSHLHDPLISLAAASAVTKKITLGTGISLISVHDPILMAKQVASLDVLSGGRVVIGVGAGWNEEEMANHGVAYKQRWKVLRERVLAMRTIWSQDEPEFHGDFVEFDPIWSYPKPLQEGGPSILLGASSRWSWDRIAEYADGWCPIYRDPKYTGAENLDEYAQGIQATHDAWSRADRAGSPNCSIVGVGHDEGRVNELLEMGFDRIIFGLPPLAEDKILPMLDRLAELVAAVRNDRAPS